MDDEQLCYKTLFQKLEEEHGKLDEETIISDAGFSYGGLVNMCSRKEFTIFLSPANFQLMTNNFSVKMGLSLN